MEAKYKFAQQLVRDAGAFLRHHLYDELKIEEKDDFTDLVTHLDKQIQEEMTEKILARYPADVIYGEEGGAACFMTEGHVWVIDPIDGTSNFIAQKDDFAILLAYFEDGQGKFALIYHVMQDKLFHGGGLFPVYRNEDLLSPPAQQPLSLSLIGLNAKLYAKNVHGLADLADQCLGIRSVGSAGIGFVHVLEGKLVSYASYLYPWDYAAASILGEGLGFRLISLDQASPSYQGREHVLLLPSDKLIEMKRYLF